jgi:hypothetical protein
MFLDMVNVFWRSFEIPLLQKELFVSFQLSLMFFVCLCTWSEEDKLYYLSMIAIFIQKMKKLVRVCWCWCGLQSLSPSKALLLQSPSHQSLSPSESYIIQSLVQNFSFSQVSIVLKCAQNLVLSELKVDSIHWNLILWSCTLEHTLTYPIVLLYFVIIKT